MAKKPAHHGKQHAVAKHPAHHKPAKTNPGGVMKGVSAKHAGSHKHKTHAKKHHPGKTKRTLALGEAVGCCAAEALAASLRLAGWPVSDADVLALYWLTADDADAGASIWDTLEAAARYGVAGVRPVSFRPVSIAVPGSVLGVTLPGGPHAVTVDASGAVWSWRDLYRLDELQPGPVEEAWAVQWQ